MGARCSMSKPSGIGLGKQCNLKGKFCCSFAADGEG